MSSEVIELTSTDADGFVRRRVISLEAMASWGELLGLTEPSEILSAIVYVQDHGEPPVDAATGESVWADAFRAIAAREYLRGSEMKRAELEGTADDPRSPRLRGALAALSAKADVHAARMSVRMRLLPAEMENVAPALPINSAALADEREAFVGGIRDAVVG